MSVESNGLFIQMLLIPYLHKHITCIVSAWRVNLSQLKGTPEALPCFLSPKAIQVQTINTIFVACGGSCFVLACDNSLSFSHKFSENTVKVSSHIYLQ